MREILFHGKRIDNNEWVEGFLVMKANPLLGTMSSFILKQEFDTSCIDGRPTALKREMTWYEVYPETVGQYTGLTDKNGKKIFEGDILNNAEVKGVVFYSEKSACFMLRWKNFDKFRKDFFKECKMADFALFEYMEVIGNIHDNPELLGGGEDG